MCAKGSDQFRDVIRQGESFLQQHPNSEYRPFVIHLVGQAYATRWTLSNEPTAAMADYVDPKPYKEGAEQARAEGDWVFRASPATVAWNIGWRIRVADAAYIASAALHRRWIPILLCL